MAESMLVKVDTINIRENKLLLVKTSNPDGYTEYIVRRTNYTKDWEQLTLDESDVLLSKIHRFCQDELTVNMTLEIKSLLIRKIGNKVRKQMGYHKPRFEIKIDGNGSIKQMAFIVDKNLNVPQKKVFKVLSMIMDKYVFNNYRQFKLPIKYEYIDNEGCAFTVTI